MAGAGHCFADAAFSDEPFFQHGQIVLNEVSGLVDEREREVCQFLVAHFLPGVDVLFRGSEAFAEGIQFCRAWVVLASDGDAPCAEIVLIVGL